MIRISLDKTGNELSDLLLFNNIITGYLEISGGKDGETGRNIASFQREIDAQNRSKTPDSNLTNLTEALDNLRRDGGEAEFNPSTPTLDAKTVREKIIRDISSEPPSKSTEAKAETIDVKQN